MPMDESVRDKLTAAEKALAALDYETARTLFQAVLDADSQCAEALHGIGFVLMIGHGRFEEGLELMESAAELAPESQKILLNLAKSYAMLAEDEKVKPLLLKVIELDETSREGQEARNQLQYYS